MKKVITILAILLIAVSANAQVQYEIIDLGVQVNATGINNNGQVVGIYSGYEGGSIVDHAILWNNNSMTYLEGAMSHAYDINDNGQIVGWARVTLNDPQYPVLWEYGTTIESNLGADLYGDARAINNNGQVVGMNYSASIGRPYIWTVKIQEKGY